MTYVCIGAAGTCGRRHDSILEATRCVRAHQRARSALGAQSDHVIFRADSEPLSAAELMELGACSRAVMRDNVAHVDRKNDRFRNGQWFYWITADGQVQFPDVDLKDDTPEDLEPADSR